MTLFRACQCLYSANDQHEKGLSLVREFRTRTQKATLSLPVKVRETIPRAGIVRVALGKSQVLVAVKRGPTRV